MTTQAEEYVAKIKALKSTQHPEHSIEDDVETMEDREMLDNGRWSILMRSVYKCADGSHFAITWDEPATEYQESGEWNPGAYLVEAQEVTVTKYVKVKS